MRARAGVGPGQAAGIIPAALCVSGESRRKRTRCGWPCAVALAVATLVSAAPAGDYYVDGLSGSDDTGDGSAAFPWASIEHAAQAVPPDSSVYITGGQTYVLSSAVAVVTDYVVFRPKPGSGEVTVDAGTQMYAFEACGCAGMEVRDLTILHAGGNVTLYWALAPDAGGASGCNVTSSAAYGAVLCKGSCQTISECTITTLGSGSLRYGICASNSTGLTIDGCTIQSAAACAVYLDGDTSPTISNSAVCSTEAITVRACRCGMIAIEDCQVISPSDHAVLVTDTTHLSLEGGSVTASAEGAACLWLQTGCGLTARDVALTSEGGHALTLMYAGDALVEDSTLRALGGDAVYTYESGSLTITDSQLEASAQEPYVTAVYALDGGPVVISRSTLSASSSHQSAECILVQNCGSAVITNNTVLASLVYDGISVCVDTDAVISDNVVEAGRGHGIMLGIDSGAYRGQDGSRGTISGNVVTAKPFPSGTTGPAGLSTCEQVVVPALAGLFRDGLWVGGHIRVELPSGPEYREIEGYEGVSGTFTLAAPLTATPDVRPYEVFCTQHATLVGACDGVSMFDNVVEGGYYGLVVKACLNVEVRDNVFTSGEKWCGFGGWQAGIYDKGSDGTHYSGNRVAGWKRGLWQYRHNDLYSINVKATGNVLSGCGTGSYCWRIENSDQTVDPASDDNVYLCGDGCCMGMYQGQHCGCMTDWLALVPGGMDANSRVLWKECIPLADDWNLISPCRDFPSKWADILITDGVEMLRVPAAASAGWIQELAFEFAEGAYLHVRGPDWVYPSVGYWLLCERGGLQLVTPSR